MAADPERLGAFVLDSSTPRRIYRVNEQFESLTGYSSVEAVGRPLSLLPGLETCSEAIDTLVRANMIATVRTTCFSKQRMPFLSELALRQLRDDEVSDLPSGRYYLCTMNVPQQLDQLGHLDLPTPAPLTTQTTDESRVHEFMLRRLPKRLDDALTLTDMPLIITELDPPFRIVHVNNVWCARALLACMLWALHACDTRTLSNSLTIYPQ